MVILCDGCTSSAPLGSNAQKPYLWEPLPHHPQMAWHRHRIDSAALYLKVPAHEPLHLRTDGEAPFGFSLEIELLAQPLEWPEAESSEAPPVAVHRFQWQERAEPGRNALVQRFVFPLPMGRYRIVHTVRDRHRGSDVTGATLLDAWSEQAPVRRLAVDLDTGEPAWEHALPRGANAALLVPADFGDELFRHAHLPPVDSFPSAPFLDRNPSVLQFPEGDTPTMPIPAETGGSERLPEGNWKGWKMLKWTADPGVHRWLPATGNRPSLVASRRPHFPVMRDLDEMIRATRYISTRKEYVALRESRDPKMALDEFWLGFCDGPETARALIKSYYGRVREANVHFSGLKEGWCTDRGMVHILFGHADRIRRDRGGETWIYGEEGDVNSLVFRFNARDLGDDFNHLQLERYPGFRSPWEAMVSSWRRGKVRKR